MSAILKCASTRRCICGMEFRSDHCDSTIGWPGFNMTHLSSQVHPPPSIATTTLCESLPKTSCEGFLTPDTSPANPPSRARLWIFHTLVPYFAHSTPLKPLLVKNTCMSRDWPPFIPCKHIFLVSVGPNVPIRSNAPMRKDKLLKSLECLGVNISSNTSRLP